MKYLLPLIFSMLLPLAVLAQGTECRSRESFDVAQAAIDEELKALRDFRPDKELEAKAAALGWSKSRQSVFFKKLYASPNYTAFHTEQAPYVRALGDAVVSSSGPSPTLSKCEAAKQVKSLGAKIMAVNVRKGAYAAREFRLANGEAK
jgi:hypothetical protein